jgi:hypothetical protein
MSSTEYKLEDHIVLFVDLLGFGEISTNADEITSRAILKMLIELAAQRGPYAQQTEQTADISFSGTFRPEISTFSDHVVFSFPLVDPDGQLPHQSRAVHLIDLMSAWVAAFALSALDLGMLARGGLTIGKLFHKSGVVFGPAMIEAYHLESKVANYPRIATSSMVLDHNSYHIVRDVDGICHLDYMPFLVAFQKYKRDGSSMRVEDKTTEHSKQIGEKIKDLESRGKWAELSKWGWFEQKYTAALEERIKLDAAFKPGESDVVISETTLDLARLK